MNREAGPVPYLFDHLDAVAATLNVSPFGLITDIDGTISEIAESPQEASVSPVCRKQLALLSQRLALVAAISGRPVLDAKRMVGIEEMVYVGNHGLEQWQDGTVRLAEALETYPTKVTAAIDELSAALDLAGLLLENKTVGLSIHYRRCPDAQVARRLILNAMATSQAARDFRVHEGKMVVELRPPVEVNKGAAVEGLVRAYGLRAGIYVGDDSSDVDAFHAMHADGLKGLAVGVIGPETPQRVAEEADLTLNGVGDVERFLLWLAEAAPAPTQPRP
jgi:trehalose 6-phosphate phosphatase